MLRGLGPRAGWKRTLLLLLPLPAGKPARRLWRPSAAAAGGRGRQGGRPAHARARTCPVARLRARYTRPKWPDPSGASSSNPRWAAILNSGRFESRAAAGMACIHVSARARARRARTARRLRQACRRDQHASGLGHGCGGQPAGLQLAGSPWRYTTHSRAATSPASTATPAHTSARCAGDSRLTTCTRPANVGRASAHPARQ